MGTAAHLLKRVYKSNGRSTLARVLQASGFSIDRPDLRSRANRWIEFDTAADYRPPSPVGPDPVPIELKKNRRLLDPQPFVCELTDVQLVGSQGLPITRDGRFILECAEGSSQLLADTIAAVGKGGYIPTRRNENRFYERPVASLLGLWSDGFFHWFADYLPRVRGIKVYANRTGVYPDVLIDGQGPTWQRKSLELVGVPEERIIEADSSRVTCDCLVIPSFPRQTEADSPSWGYTHSPRGLRWVGEQILDSLGIQQGTGNRILITRRDAAERRLANEGEVIETLSSYGFEPVTLTKHSLESQVNLFANADTVVAPHGAGLVNSIYSTDLSVLELFGNEVNACYYCLAAGLDFTYRYELCRDDSKDLIVDTEAVNHAVQTIFE